MKPDITFSWHALSPVEVLEQLETPGENGLSTEEVIRRRTIYGSNQITEAPRTTFWQMVLAQLNNFVIILLIVAAVISALLGDWVEAGAILAIVILNAVLGVVQESRAEEALAALKKLAAPEARVLRDGHRVSVPAGELVPGDIVFLEAGNYIPADVRLLEAVNLRIEEAALTGESLPVEKNAAAVLEKDIPIGDRKNTAFMGTLVSYGRGKGVVVATGMQTQLGLIAGMLQSVEQEETPLQRRLDQLGKVLGWGALGVCALVFVIGILRSGGELDAIVNMFMVAVSLAIAAVPEGLPAIVTISLALGMREMIRRHALIRRLSSVETLGSATVICSDKTGTLTQNEMTVTRVWADGQTFEVTGSGYTPIGDFKLGGQHITPAAYPGLMVSLWLGVLNNDAHLEVLHQNGSDASYRVIGDPTEGAILVAAHKAGLLAEPLTQAYPRAGEIPFDSDRKRMVTLHLAYDPLIQGALQIPALGKDWYVIAVKGAPDVVLNLCSYYQSSQGGLPQVLDEQARQRILSANDYLTANALRVLGVAYRPAADKPTEVNSSVLESELIFAGLIGMIDPPRPEVIPALLKASGAGIRTVMITGDYPNTARAIAEEIGLLRPGHRVVTGHDMDGWDESTTQRMAMETDVYARVSPEHKMRIVDALRANNQVVAMTGDGVNDAPAIKRADIGVAMGITGTDVAKETADMVLTDDNYASIVSAVEQGRIIYSNIRKFVYYLLSCNLAEIAIIFLALLFGWPSPLTPLQLLWLNLVTDGAPALALGTEKGDPDIMSQPPRPPKESIINKTMRTGILVQTVAITAVTLFAYYLGRNSDPQHLAFAETMAFVTLSASELLRAYTARSEFFPLLKIGIFGNKFMNYALVSSLVLILAVIYIPFLQNVFDTRPLGWSQWLEILPLLLIPSLAAEVTKYVQSSLNRKKMAQGSAAIS
jgi:Ca2+-transporting ATPase